MNGPDRSLLRRIAEWDPEGAPVVSIYLSVDGRRYPRRGDLELRMDELVRRARAQAGDRDKAARRSIDRDLERMSELVRTFQRGDTRALALFGSSAMELWQEVRVPRPIRDRSTVAPQADLAPLEALFETFGKTCIALVDHEHARLLLVHLGRVEEVSEFADDVPGRHDQGGRSQARMQRHVDVHRRDHLKRVGERLFRTWKREGFERLILTGPGEAPGELEAMLHEYLRSRVVARFTMPMTSTIDEVRSRAIEVEEELEREEERSKVDRVAGLVRAGDRAVAGLEPTLAALAEGRADEMLVAIDLSAPGRVCRNCGRLTTRRGRCPTCGSETDEIADVVDAAVAAAFRGGSRVEIVAEDGAMEPLEGVGALLRF
jgi:peptide chain release factor subunit 1